MQVRFVRRLASVAAVLVLVAGIAAKHAATAQQRDPVASVGGAEVRTVPAGARVTDDPARKGDTFYWFESQTVRSKMRFGDTTVEASRGGDGKLHAKVVDRAGNVHGDLTASSTLVQFKPPDDEVVQAQNDSGERPTLDWAARQAYGLSRDGVTNLVWDAGVMRPRRAPRRDSNKEVDEVETVWADGLVAKLEKRDLPPHELGPGRVVGGPAWLTTLTANGVPAGYSVWFDKEQVFAYSLPGLTTGLIWTGPEHLKALYGGWPFKPDVTWLNLQTIAAHHFRTLAAKDGLVAKRCEPPQQNRLAQFFFPTVHANDVGCDGFHYLDGTLFRACCDDHDRCYSKEGCGWRSWWQVWKSWSCDWCNMAAVACFSYVIDFETCIARSWFNC